jgi:hypothetical protein
MENLLNQNNTLEDMAMNFPESLRAYANWCDEHPTLQQNANITTYGETAQQAKGIMLADSCAKLDLSTNNNIVYLSQVFGEILVQHVLLRSEVCNLAIVDNQVVSVLKPEFAKLVTP